MKQRIYLDTSVISALHDLRAPERRELTAAFWSRLSEFECSSSDAAREEIGNTPDPKLRASMNESLNTLVVFPITDEMRVLANSYISARIFSPTQETDALHVAAAVATRHDVLVSWNFKHLVNRRRRGMVNALNLQLGAAAVDIISPPEL